MYIKREILQGIETLNKVNKKLKLIQCGAGNEAIEQSQELAIMIGNRIEECGVDHSVTIGFLEEYCETLYKAFVCKNNAEYKQIVKEMGYLLKRIERSVKEDIPNSAYEILFLPYKVSMWDAFDSVYRAVKEDKDCHVRVMPVPYYNMNHKDKQIEMHYEGDQLPEDVPVIDYKSYSLEEVHPDVIFIHNPYDQCNYVTQLPEQYFSSTLVQYTDYLVYIPYFITRGDSIKEEYCVMPAVKNAWRTFVQSESVRKCYIKYGADSNRIVAMGSPKFDMVIRSQNNPVKIPENWRKVFKERKIFLLNTHLTSIINKAEKMIDKMHKIFELFRQEKSVALLWRPHPLSIETAKAMNPQILDSYLKIIEEFKELENGVYDDTPDIHRAIAVSDAYIGDWSSVATLYGITGKPMYIMSINADTNIEENEKEKEERERGLSFSCAAELDGYLWAPGDEVNGLFRICEETGESEFITSFSKESFGGKLLYRKVVAYGRKLFFMPERAEYIAEYNIDTNTMNYYEIYNNERTGCLKFCGCSRVDDKLYFFPYELRDIVTLNMKSGKIEQKAWNVNIVPEEIRNCQYSKFNNAIKIDNTEYLLCGLSNIFIKINLDNFQCEMVRIPETKEGMMDAANDKEYLYIMTTSGDIYCYNIKSRYTKLFWKNGEKTIDDKLPYCKLLVNNGFLYQIPANAENIQRINIKTKKVERIVEYPEGFKMSECKWTYPWNWLNGEVKNERLFLYPYKANMLLKWDDNKKGMNGLKLKIRTTKKWEKYRKSRDKEAFLYHEIGFSLFYFLNLVIEDADDFTISRKEYFKGLQCKADGTCGESIWKYIKSYLN